ncbi:MAG TPA: SDR family NAD(P)-dependent oxidoreductase, partial [Steroidobacteraceae bacterium]|nr:SDR family NAD(P)-dependent oxidoreductase [Steroidobacteraceae bacterium]
MDVRGKTILVTGAGRGIGRSLAEHFAKKGGRLALLDTNAEDLGETCARCVALGAEARSYLANAANEDSVVAALDQIVSDFGRLDGLINNAGIVRDAMLVKVKDGQVVSKMTLAQWQAVIDVNLTAVFLCAREAAQRMITRATGGVIVNISSIC